MNGPLDQKKRAAGHREYINDGQDGVLVPDAPSVKISFEEIHSSTLQTKVGITPGAMLSQDEHALRAVNHVNALGAEFGQATFEVNMMMDNFDAYDDTGAPSPHAPQAPIDKANRAVTPAPAPHAPALLPAPVQPPAAPPLAPQQRLVPAPPPVAPLTVSPPPPATPGKASGTRRGGTSSTQLQLPGDPPKAGGGVPKQPNAAPKDPAPKAPIDKANRAGRKPKPYSEDVGKYESQFAKSTPTDTLWWGAEQPTQLRSSNNLQTQIIRRIAAAAEKSEIDELHKSSKKLAAIVAMMELTAAGHGLDSEAFVAVYDHHETALRLEPAADFHWAKHIEWARQRKVINSSNATSDWLVQIGKSALTSSGVKQIDAEQTVFLCQSNFVARRVGRLSHELMGSHCAQNSYYLLCSQRGSRQGFRGNSRSDPWQRGFGELAIAFGLWECFGQRPERPHSP